VTISFAPTNWETLTGIRIPDEISDFGNADRVKSVCRFIQYEKFRVMQDGVGNSKTLLHAKGILAEHLFVLIRQYILQQISWGFQMFPLCLGTVCKNSLFHYIPKIVQSILAQGR